MSIEWIQTLQSLAQAGLAYTKDPFDRQRFDAILRLAVDMLATTRGLPLEQAERIIFDERGYRTPKVDVRGAVFQDDALLLVKEKSDGLWCLPGGWADISETPSEAVTREVREETGLMTQASRLIAVHDTRRRGPQQYYHSYKMIFLCERLGGNLEATDEISELAFFKPNDIPPLSERRTTRELVDLIFVHHVQNQRPADFD